MDAATTVEAYYEALRSGEPLYPYFARDDSTVKFGIGERLTGYEEVREGLREQTETTDGWTVESSRLRVGEAESESVAWFSDEVALAWSDLERGIRYEFETRWSGTMERRPDEPWDGHWEPPTPWRFVGMHVSTPGETR